jgi:methionyl-tRNA synthetase
MTTNDAPDPTHPFYVSTAIPYVNAAPHVGFAYEAVLADVLARHQRLRGRSVHFQSGTDDNSLKNVQAAEREGLSPAALVAGNAGRFLALADALGLSYDDFIRTGVEDRHRQGVEALWGACLRAGDLYRRPYRGLYCVGCEGFFDPAELAEGRCPEHGTSPEPIEEENWFFRLSRYRDPLRRLVETGALQIAPRSRRNEVLGFLAGGLEDISVSRARARARGWGIPVPGDPEQVVYVWFDALSNYVNTLGWVAGGDAYRRFWAGSGRRLHVLGKGILRFHAVHWPAILLSAGLPPPTDLLVHGYLTVDGRKIGKSLGNAVDPADLVARYGAEPGRNHRPRHTRPF